MKGPHPARGCWEEMAAPARGPPAFGKGPRLGTVLCWKAVVLRFQKGVRQIHLNTLT